ncbi:MAG: hypothetical protein OXC57_14730 [Rhodobacteraceae bacterium]|nr:hypothetical protein [Paracoccaceae bacterium]
MPISRAELLDAFSRLRAALLLSLFVAFVSGAHEARAQDQVLVSNIGQANPTTTFLGLQGASPVVSSWGVYDHAQGFTTGTNKGGYKLHSAEIQFGRIGTGLTYTVRIQNPLANGKPGSVVGTLTTPTFSSSNDDQIVTFTAPQGGIDLEASKEYLLVLAVSGTRDEQITGWNYTESDAEDSGGLSGWQIANTHQFRSEMAISILNITAGWQDNLLDGALQFRLKGDVAPSFAIADAEATEGDPITFTVNRNGASGAAVSVQWTTSTTGGTYTAASSDFTAQTTAQTLSFAAGDTSKTIEIQTTEDSIDEADETFGVILSAPSTGTSISDGTAIGTITDDDTRGVTVSASALTLDEIDDGSTQGTTENEGTYTIKLNTEPTADVTITPTVPNGAPFTISPTTSLTFTPLNWETAQTITVTAINDDLDNPADQREATITHTLVAADGSDYSGVSVSDVTITVTDDDAEPSFAIADAEATEGDPITFTVNRNGASGAAVSVQWTTSTTGGTYTAASSDFTAQTTAQTLSFAAGDTSKTIEIQTTEDSIDEADETFGVILSAPSTGTSISDGTAIGTITDDDTRGVTVSASALTLDEIDDGSTQGTTENEGTYTIKLNTEPTADVTITPTVPNGAPFTISPTTSLTFTPLNWETAQTITVTAINDDLDNPADQREATITHTLVAADGSDYSGVSVSDVTITVTDDDIPVVSFVSASSQAAENGGMHYIMVTIEPVSSGNFMINLLEEGDATNGEDYKLKPDVMIAAGKSSVRLQVEIMEDDIVEEDETLKITLQSPNNNQEIKWGQKTHEVKIVDHTRLANSRNLSEWQVRFGRAVTEQVLDGITKRIEAPRHAPTQIQIAGYPLDLNGTDHTSVQDSALTFNNNTNLGDTTNNSFVSQNDLTEQNIMSLREALLESNFTVIGQNPSTQENHAFWGQISQSFFEGREGELSLEGDTTTAMLGTDVTKGKWLIGMAILQSVGKGSYTQSDKPKNAIDATLTALVPYASLTASERFSIWGTLGFGSGWITRSPDPKQIQKADIEWSMAAIGFRNNLMMGVETGGLNLAVVGDSFYTATKSEKTEDLDGTSGKVTRVRLGLEGARKITLKDNKSLTPRFTVSLRQDGGDAETGWGMEVSVGMSWQDTESGLEADFSAKNLVAHTSNGFSNWGYSLSVTYDPNPYTKRGFSASYNQSLSGSNNDIFNTLPQAGQFGQEEIGAISRQAEVSYGFPAFDGSYANIPFVAVKESGYTRDLTLGGRLTREHGSPQLDVSYRAKRIEGSGHVPNYAVGLDLKTHW